MSEEKTITIRKDDLWKYLSFFLFAVVLIAGVFLFTGNSDDGSINGNPVAQGQGQDEGKASASVDDDAVLGDPDAPVTIIEFSDYQCAYCGRHYTQTLPLIKSEYIDTGKVKLVFRDFPLASLHPMAIPSAEAAECVRDIAGNDEAYFEYHDIIFENQNLLSTDNLKSWAKDLGYNIDSCLDSGKFRNEVQKDSVDAQSAGFGGTPGFLIMKSGAKEGTPLKGAYPFSAFQQIIEAELA
jgi:protein-disulfide isomerase|tara:strand:- start:5682 stop:6398 length:717 start_codon:yes stop_codon:yes gene_type:complete